MKLSRSEAQGFLLLSSVVVIWVLSGFFIQNLFASHYNHPVAMTVFSVGLCALLLCVPRSWREGAEYEKKNVLGRSLISDVQNDEISLPISTRQVFTLGLVWIAGQLSYNVSLKFMSVSSSTAVSSMSSIFTFGFSWIFLEGYRATVYSVVAILLSTIGIFVIAYSQPAGAGVEESPVGFFIAGLSCCCYGLFTTLLKKWNTNRPASVTTLFGSFGVVALCVGIPLVGLAHQTRFDEFEFPSKSAVFGMSLNAVIGSVVSDILLAKSVLLLNPITVSLGLSLTMPVSMFVDSVVLQAHSFKAAYAVGVVLQFASVYCISVDNHRQHRL